MQNNDNFPRLPQSFFGQRLIAQRRVSPHTIASYRDTFRLLLQFAKKRLHKEPSQLELKDLNASLIGAFLDDLEKCRHNGARSRNLRLTAARSFFRYAALETPEHVGLISTSAGDSEPTPASCLGGFPDPVGNRCVVGGAQPEHAAGTTRSRHAPPCGANRVEVIGDDRTEARRHLARYWPICSLSGERTQGTLYSLGQVHRRGAQVLDSGTRRRRFQNSVSQHARRRLVRRWGSAHAQGASGGGTKDLPNVVKKRVSPHVLRHTAAMEMLQVGVDRAMIALWLGHESVETTQIYYAQRMVM